MRILTSFFAFTLVFSLANLNPLPVHADFRVSSTDQYYDIGSPVLEEIYISPTGSDDNSGVSQDSPFQTIGAAWRMIPNGTLSSTGYRINLMPGSYPCESDCINYFAGKHGTYDFPIIIRALNGTGTVQILGGLNISRVDYLYLINLTLLAGGGYPLFANNVIHCEECHYFLMRGLTIRGPNPDTTEEIQEVIKINQSQHVYIEDTDTSGSYQNILDYFSVQYGHVLNSRLHHSGDWCGYVKGGSAYLVFDGNELDHCRLGFSAGEGSNLEVMVSPWLHYEAYDLKFTNNILHDIVGLGIRAAGGYDILFAYNTFYKIATDTEIGYSLFHAVHGARGCTDTSENGVGNGVQLCNQKLTTGGWGPNRLTDSVEVIPNRNVFVFNNIFYNPIEVNGTQTQFYIERSVAPPSYFRNIPNPSPVDSNLQIKGNIIWNKPDEREIGAGGEGQGCQNGNPSCTIVQIQENNSINTMEPQFVDEAHGDFHPALDSNIYGAVTHIIPDFTWADSPLNPVVPSGNLANSIAVDREGITRIDGGPAGAFVGSASLSPSARLIAPSGTIVDARPVFHWTRTEEATSYLLKIIGPAGDSENTLTPAELGCVISCNDCTYTPQTDLPAGIFSWRVQIITSSPGAWSAAQDFYRYQPVLPAVTSMKPGGAQVYGKSLWITIKGNNFGKDAKVFFNSSELRTRRLSSSKIMAFIPNTLLQAAGSASIRIRNTDSLIPSGVFSASKPFNISNPKPLLTGNSPRKILAGSGETILTLSGKNFTQGAIAYWNHMALVTTFVNRSRVTAIIPPSLSGSKGKATLMIINPGPGGGASRAKWVLIY